MAQNTLGSSSTESEKDTQTNQGYFYSPSGHSYRGNWKDDKKDGFGKLVFDNGEIYEGEFLNDMKHGPGKYRNKTHKA